MEHSLKAGPGLYGFGVAGGEAVEAYLFKNQVQGMLLAAPSTGSTQATGTGASDFNVNIAAGIVVVDGTPKEFAAQADFSLFSGTPADMADGESRVYSIIAVKSPVTGEISLQVWKGAAAASGSEKPVDRQTIIDSFDPNTFWFEVGRVTVNRTGDLTVTQSQDSTKRPLFVAKSWHDSN